MIGIPTGPFRRAQRLMSSNQALKASSGTSSAETNRLMADDGRPVDKLSWFGDLGRLT